MLLTEMILSMHHSAVNNSRALRIRSAPYVDEEHERRSKGCQSFVIEISDCNAAGAAVDGIRK